MFLLIGTRTAEAILSILIFVCPYCGVSAEQSVVKRSTKLSAFFIPLFTIGSSHFVECSNCGRTTPLTAAQARHAVDWAEARGVV